MVRLRAGVDIREDPFRRALKRLAEANKRTPVHRVTLGIHEGENDKVRYDGSLASITLAEVAVVHEYGATVNGIKIPERSFMRSWFDQNSRRLRTEMAAAERAEAQGNEGAVRNLALRWQSELKTWITSRQAGFVPLSPETIKDRANAGIDSETPLHATGQLVESIRVKLDGEYID